MKKTTAFRLLFAPILATVLVFTTVSIRAQQTSSDGRDQNGSGAPAQPTAAADSKDKKADSKDNKDENAREVTKQSGGSAKAKDPAAPAQGNSNGPYSIFSSVEFGVRGVAIHGNGDKYRSDLNYEPGFRLFDSSLMMKAQNGGGVLFDQLMVNSFGWGNDPSRYLRVSTEKTKLFKFDANYRRVDYFRDLLNIAAPGGVSQHTFNTEYRQGDFDLTILPANEKFRLNLGYSLDRNTGPAVTTTRFSSDEFPVLMPTRQSADDYRIGFDSKLWVFDISFLQGWRTYKEDTTYLVDQTQPGNNATNSTVVNTFQRNVPSRGETPYTRFSLHTFLAKRVDFTGRYIYESGNTEYSFVESVTGKDSANNRVASDAVTVLGNAKRPNAIGDAAVTVLATDHLRISDSFRVQTFRITGGEVFNEILFRFKTNPFGEVPVLPFPAITNTLGFSFTNYRRYVNTLEGDYDLNSRLSFHLGYRYTNRHIEERPIDLTAGQPAPEAPLETFDNETNSVIFGLKTRPFKIWSLYFDMEHGENDNVFTRTANYDYTNFRVRSVLRPTRRLTLNASLVTKDNTNPVLTEDLRNFGADVNSRVFSASADWTPKDTFNISGGYTYFHLTSETVVRFFLTDRLNAVEGLARYFMKDNFAYMTAYWEPHPRLRLYGSYRIHNDRGQGDRVSTSDVLLNSFPYQFQSPEFKFSVKLHRNVDWIVGYQYFDYKEKFVNKQFYQAHLPYTSLRIYFGTKD